MSNTQTITQNKARAVIAEATAMHDTLREDGYQGHDLRERITLMETALFEAEVAGSDVEVYGDIADLAAEYPGAEYLNDDGTLA